MKTEFNVERVCERVQLCIVDAPDELGAAKIEVRNGSIHVSFPEALHFMPEELHQKQILARGPDEIAKQIYTGIEAKPKRRGKNAQG